MPNKTVYFGLSLDKIDCEIVITGFGTDAEVVRRNARKRHDAPDQLVVALDADSGSVIEKWLRSCGIDSSEITTIRQMIGLKLLELSNAK